VRVSASSSALVHRLAGDLAEFVHSHPDIRIDLEERPSGETISQMARGQADLGVFIRGVPTSGLQVWPYAQDRLSLAVYQTHRLAEQDSVQFRDLLNDDFVALEVGSAIYRLMAEKAREQGRYLKTRVQVRSFEVMCQMIRSGLGIGILPEEALRPLALALGLSLIRLEEDWAIRHIDIGVQAGHDIAPPTKRLLAALCGVDLSL
jgi:DNA-binding transcriptional LysR family regulator